MTTKMWRKAAIVVCAGVLLSMAGTADAESGRVRGAGPLQDLQVATSQPTDGATAQVFATESDGSTTVTLKVQALHHMAAGTTLGAHLHVGSCVEGNGAAAGPHYNIGGVPSPQTEVWLDITIGDNGTAQAETTVPFVVPPGGAAAVVIHAEPTHHGPPAPGTAGIRLACLPVQF
jgi:superoxide dismutase, Cu-Zn family